MAKVSNQNNLIFDATYTIDAFKKQFEVTEVKVLDNTANGGKLFFATNKRIVSGKVSGKFDPKKEVVISQVSDETTGETFLLLHNHVDSALAVVASW